MESNYRYYSRRAAEERRRARVAVTEAARARHKDLAVLFETKATIAATIGRWSEAAAQPLTQVEIATA